MTGHTPGPWEYQPAWLAGSSALVFDQDERPICEVDVYRDECEANARLIATAPELLDLVKRLRQWDDLPGRADGPFWIEQADAVIAKAGGRAS